MSKYTIGLDNLYFALVTKDDATGVTYDAMLPAPGVISVDITVETTSGDLYADDMNVDHYEAISAYNVAIDIASLTDELRAKLAGHEYDELTQTVIEKATDVAPSVGMAFRSMNSDGSYKYVKLMSGKFTESGDSYKTKGENTEYQTKKLNGKFTPRTYDKVLRKTTDDATVSDTWFTSFGDETAPVA